ncbi:MAG: TIM barrel protein [Gemmatimonadaceae bacterium]|jgi:endonuclease IV
MFGPHVDRVHARGARATIAEHVEAARRAAEVEAGFAVRAVSMFVGGPRDRQIIVPDAHADALREYLARTGIRAIAHSSYSAVPWRGDPDAARFIREESRVCARAGIAGLVVHLPKAPVDQVMKYIARLYDPAGVRIYLETPAVRPDESYYETPEKLAALFRAIREKLDSRLDHFGLCVDSAHLWTCGVDVASYAAADAWLGALEQKHAAIPHDRVMIHLNDSRRARGVGPDAHAGLAAGEIWKEYAENLPASGLAAFVDYARRHDTVCILERKPAPALLDDYRALRELAAEATD